MNEEEAGCQGVSVEKKNREREDNKNKKRRKGACTGSAVDSADVYEFGDNYGGREAERTRDRQRLRRTRTREDVR